MPDTANPELRIVQPPFESSLTDLIIDLDVLRKKTPHGTTPQFIFSQLKNIFHMLESLASARIEGNNTTLADYVESRIEARSDIGSNLREIRNMEECLAFIDEHIGKSIIDRAFVSELHKMTVRQLPPPPVGEGDKTPGIYRRGNVTIRNSPHIPPDTSTVPAFMDELFEFIRTKHESKYDLLKVAIAHHRFVWVHPFTNGNGRVVRLLTYAMLIKYGFAVDKGRILNPAAVFCHDRMEYYDKLALADTGTDENILTWCEYVLKGLKTEIKKIDNLLDYSFLKKGILLPAIEYALDRQFITRIEAGVLKRTVEMTIVKAGDLADIVASQHDSERSRIIHRLKEKKMLNSLPDSPRKYTISFNNNFLLRAIIKLLSDEGFVSVR